MSVISSGINKDKRTIKSFGEHKENMFENDKHN